MNRFWNKIILPIIESINAKYIVEIGSDTGIGTENILKYCIKNDAYMTAIDPNPNFNVAEFKKRYKNRFEIYEDLSLNVLHELKDYDVILIDGDHNWYTVYNELKIIEQSFKGNKFPIVFLHDTAWPYARRDLYYNPKTIPEEYVQPYEKKGMYPGESNLREKGGLNYVLYNANRENTPKNGVLTAIEDFIHESNIKFSFEIIDAFFGLGILFPKDEELENFVKTTIKNANFLSHVEEDHLKREILLESHIIDLQEHLTTSNAQNQELQENNSQLKKDNETLQENNSQLKENNSQLKKDNNKLDNQFSAKKKQVSELQTTIGWLKYKTKNISSRLKKKFKSH